jgi:hypothetical protein
MFFEKHAKNLNNPQNNLASWDLQIGFNSVCYGLNISHCMETYSSIAKVTMGKINCALPYSGNIIFLTRENQFHNIYNNESKICISKVWRENINC